MNSDTLTEISLHRIADITNRYHYLLKIGREKDACLLAREGAMIARALDDNDPFLVLHLPESFNV